MYELPDSAASETAGHTSVLKYYTQPPDGGLETVRNVSMMHIASRMQASTAGKLAHCLVLGASLRLGTICFLDVR